MSYPVHSVRYMTDAGWQLTTVYPPGHPCGFPTPEVVAKNHVRWEGMNMTAEEAMGLAMSLFMAGVDAQ